MNRSWKSLQEIPNDFGPTAVTIGNFDGVHLGHQRILQSVVRAAQARSLSSVALTFDPHPLTIVAPAQAPKTLTSIRQRVDLIRRQGIDRVAILAFTSELSQLSPAEFAETVLARKLGARHVVVGANFRFGRKQSGDAEMLQRLGERLGFEVASGGTVLVGGEVVSSTRLRDLVRLGRMGEARRLLGREFSLQGPIVRGEGIGSRRTVPTLNLEPESQVLPADGVYVTVTRHSGEVGHRESITNVGLRPTFDGRQRTIETFLLGELAGPTPNAIELGFLRKIRDERRFPSAQSLREQIAADIAVAERYFRRLHALSANRP